METKNRRFVLNLPEELEEEIQMTKERFFHDTSYSEMYRQLIRAGLDGIQKNLTPPEPLNVNLYTAGPEITDDLQRLPDSLEEARELARNSEFIRAVLPEDILQ